jgi:hypothetical protein
MAPDQAGYAAAWLEFMNRLAAEPSGAPATTARVAALPSYGAVPADELTTGIQLSFAAALAAMTQRRPPGPDEDLSRYERSGERRARQRVALADLIQAWTIGLDVARADAFRRVPAGP